MGKQSVEAKFMSQVMASGLSPDALRAKIDAHAKTVPARAHSEIPEFLEFLYQDFLKDNLHTKMVPFMEHHEFDLARFKRAFKSKVRPVVLAYFDEMLLDVKLVLKL